MAVVALLVSVTDVFVSGGGAVGVRRVDAIIRGRSTSGVNGGDAWLLVVVFKVSMFVARVECAANLSIAAIIKSRAAGFAVLDRLLLAQLHIRMVSSTMQLKFAAERHATSSGGNLLFSPQVDDDTDCRNHNSSWRR